MEFGIGQGPATKTEICTKFVIRSENVGDGDGWLPELNDEDCTGQFLEMLDRELARRVGYDRQEKQRSASADESLRRCEPDSVARS